MDLSETFKAGGFSATACASLGEARAVIARQNYSLFVLDVLLPDGDGINLLRELKSAPATAGVPVILLSIEAEVRDRVRGLETGADDYIGKPYDPTHVLARARQLVGDIPRLAAQAEPTLLLIDDSATFRNEFKAVLEERG